jgi:hypothetical protein
VTADGRRAGRPAGVSVARAHGEVHGAARRWADGGRQGLEPRGWTLSDGLRRRHRRRLDPRGPPPARIVEWAKHHQLTLSGMPSAFFSVCLGVADDNDEARVAARKYVGDFVDETGWTPRATATSPGRALSPSRRVPRPRPHSCSPQARMRGLAIVIARAAPAPRSRPNEAFANVPS